MKLKALLIIFNIVLFALLFTVFFLPMLYPAGSYAKSLWKGNAVFGLCLFCMIVTVNTVFFKNGRLAAYIGEEDWSGLSAYLENEIFAKNKMSFKNARLYTESLVLSGNFSDIYRLEELLEKHKPQHLKKLAPDFAAVMVLSEDYARLKHFTARFVSCAGYTGDWMRFYSALACRLNTEYEAAFKTFQLVLESAEDDLARVLSAYFVFNVLKDYSDIKDQAGREEAAAAEFLKKYSAEKWKRYTDRQKTRLHIMLLSKILGPAAESFFLTR